MLNDPEPEYYNRRIPLLQVVVLDGVRYFLRPSTVFRNGRKALMVLDEINPGSFAPLTLNMSAFYAVRNPVIYFDALDDALQLNYAQIQYLYPESGS